MTDTERVEEISCDLCVLGAGIAGLNALFAAGSYLTRREQVLLVDRNAGPGGMWNFAYDYVRLHQPHPMFTAGNIPWAIDKEPSYLATRREVVDHLKHCLSTLQRRMTIDTRFGYEYRSHEEMGTEAEGVIVECAGTAPGAPALRIKAKRLIKAFGYDVKTNDALPLSSKEVRSVSPDHFDLLGSEMRASKTPVYIVGAGKTGMDTAHTLIQAYPGRQISLLIGKGTMFGCRDKMYPAGHRRWWTGIAPLSAFLDMGRRFNGHNEVDVLDYFRTTYGVSLAPDSRRFMLGLLSQQENAVIAQGVHDIIKDYLKDVVDRDGRPTLLLRSGESRAVEPGTWFVNCTGYFYKHDVPYEPYLSEGKKVLSIQASSAVHALSTHAAFLLPHLWYRGELNRLPLYELHLGELYEKNRDVFAMTIAPHSLYNASLVLKALPQKVLDDFGVDLMRWYPVPRRLLAGIRFVRYQKAHPDHMRRTLDAVRERLGIRCGPLAGIAEA